MAFEKLYTIKDADHQLVHASNICAKLNQKANGELSQKQSVAIDDIATKYLSYIDAQLKITGFSSKNIRQRVDLLNNYYNFLFGKGYDNIFSSQGKLRPTILEEFMYLVFRDVVEDLKTYANDTDNVLKLGSVKAYSNLYFKSDDIKSFINDIKTGVNVKDQDFAIYREMGLTINNGDSETVNLPIIAIEVKTYIDKTMLEGAIATAEKIKSGNPYSKFFVVSENYEVDLKVDPAYSRIDQIFVLRKSKRKVQPRIDIQADVVELLVTEVHDYLKRKWGDIETKLTTKGIII